MKIKPTKSNNYTYTVSISEDSLHPIDSYFVDSLDPKFLLGRVGYYLTFAKEGLRLDAINNITGEHLWLGYFPKESQHGGVAYVLEEKDFDLKTGTYDWKKVDVIYKKEEDLKGQRIAEKILRIRVRMGERRLRRYQGLKMETVVWGSEYSKEQ